MPLYTCITRDIIIWIFVSICVGYRPRWWSEAESEPGPSRLPTGRHLSIGRSFDCGVGFEKVIGPERDASRDLARRIKATSNEHNSKACIELFV